jgi:hypothetical protein
MNVGLIHFGATPRSTAYAAADVADTPAGLSITGRAAEGFQVSNMRPVAPVENTAEAREQARQQAMAARGVDMLALFKMSPQARIRAEADILADTARRTTPTHLANHIDIRV